MQYKPKPYCTVYYDALWYTDETFVVVKKSGTFVWIPLKIVRGHSKESKTLVLYQKIWDDIYTKAQSNTAMNNLCELYF